MPVSLKRRPQLAESADQQSHEGIAHDQQPQPWYLAYTRPRQESIALANLQAQGFNVYLPMYKTYKKQELGYEPMFPRYIFLQPCSPNQSLATVRSTRGVTNLIRFGIEIATVRLTMLDAIRALERRRNETPETELSTLRPGRRARVCDSPFSGLEGLISAVSSKRVTLLLEILGQQRELKISPSKLEALD
ncbi:transcription termination/antitermination protein NusG [Allopusillimonas ginsengisoli]|uniref:transcription termination/antitermination protein NusG n=1 Tax=Allopusillimonas ginsengisoli TaxID=453575 RepID=UPI001021EFD7|nr:transcriptional activator RfaH [Allopusillimonas ginsengisoli]TEA79944.1 transcriptional activator RfaH [Allopusillimonas ginsengisoli]